MPGTSGAAVAIIGTGQTSWRRRHEDKSSGELLRDAAAMALDEAGLGMRDVGAVVAGIAPDALAGINCPERSSFFVPPGRPFIRVNTGGTTGGAAFAQAVTMVLAGYADTVLVVALERMGHAVTSQAVFNTIFDPIYEKDITLSTLSMAALRAMQLMHLYGYTADHWAEIAARNFARAVANPYAQVRRLITVEEVRASPMLSWPIHLYEACPMSEGACAVVVSRKAPERGTAWIRGFGSYTDTYAIGDRARRAGAALVDLLTLRRAAADAYREAGVSEPVGQLQVVEIHAPFSSAEGMAYPALGLCAPEDGPTFAETTLAPDAPIVINPSGGPQAANPVSACALVRIAEAARQVAGTAGETQVEGARWAVATGQGGSNQFSMATVVADERTGRP